MVQLRPSSIYLSILYRTRSDNTAATPIQSPLETLTETAPLNTGVWLGEEALAEVGAELGCTYALLFIVEADATVTRGVLVTPTGWVLLRTADEEAEPLGTTE